MNYALEAKNLKRVYKAGGSDVTALNSVNLRIGRGRFVALKGKSGSGKTTLLNLLGGLDSPTEGEILVAGEPVNHLSEDERSLWRQKEVGFVFQSFGLLPTLSAYENVELMLRIAGYPRRERRARALECLALVGLAEWANHRPFELSGGQQQRVAVARALANRPQFILADEATAELDSQTTFEICQLLQDIVRTEGVTLLLATHDHLVDEYVDEIFLLADGEIVKHDVNDRVADGGEESQEKKVESREDEGQGTGGGGAAPNRGLGVSPQPTNRPTDHTDHTDPPTIERTDFRHAIVPTLLVALVALLTYGRTLAPDILYGDSGEFQVLAHTLGLAHTTGYSTYLLVAHLFDYLPLGTLAWRINLLSALFATGTICLLFLLVRRMTGALWPALLSGFALLISHTFWSQAIIAEVYTAGTFFWMLIMWLLFRWVDTGCSRPQLLFWAAACTALGLGFHLYVILIGPAAVLFVILTLYREKKLALAPLLPAVWGTLSGLALYLLSFWLIDRIDSPTGYPHLMIFPSRSAFGLTEADFATFWQRLYLNLSAPQWQSVMFPGGLGFMLERFGLYWGRLLRFEFSLLITLGSFWGGYRLYQRSRADFWLLLVGWLTVVFVIVNYEPGDKYLFYLPSYLVLLLLAGVGLSDWLTRLTTRWSTGRPLIIALLFFFVGQHFWPQTAEALIAGRATFAGNTYPYPVDDLSAPRASGERMGRGLPADALLLLDWRELYGVHYIATIEEGRDDVRFIEATPFGTDGVISDSLLVDLGPVIASGERPVFAQRPYPPLEERYTLTFDESRQLYRVEPR